MSEEQKPQSAPQPPPLALDGINYFAETNFRNERRKFGIKVDDRRRHMYVIGKTGMGKSTLLENMIIQDIQAGRGLAITDPHGDLAEKILDFVPSHRINDVVYLNPSDVRYPIAFNIFEHVDEEYRHLVSNGLIGVFKKIWADSWGPRLEYILMNAILALLEYPGSTLLGVTRMLVDATYRKRVLRKVEDPVVRSFWINEFNNYSEKFRSEAVAPIQNKVGQFLSSSLIRNIVGQPKSTINMREIMDNRKILIMNLSKGRIGEENAALLGAMMITKIQLAAMSRVDTPEDLRQDFYLYVDEFQNFATDSFAGILSEARKYRLDLIMAHQYIEQLEDSVRAAVFGNVGTMVTFRVGATDAEELEKEFQPQFLGEDIVTLPAYQIYLRLMIDGVASDPFSASTLPPIAAPEGNQEKVIQVSRERYAKPQQEVEDAIYIWSHSDPQHARKEIEERRAKKEAEAAGEDGKAEIKDPPKKASDDMDSEDSGDDGDESNSDSDKKNKKDSKGSGDKKSDSSNKKKQDKGYKKKDKDSGKKGDEKNKKDRQSLKGDTKGDKSDEKSDSSQDTVEPDSVTIHPHEIPTPPPMRQPAHGLTGVPTPPVPQAAEDELHHYKSKKLSFVQGMAHIPEAPQSAAPVEPVAPATSETQVAQEVVEEARVQPAPQAAQPQSGYQPLTGAIAGGGLSSLQNGSKSVRDEQASNDRSRDAGKAKDEKDKQKEKQKDIEKGEERTKRDDKRNNDDRKKGRDRDQRRTSEKTDERRDQQKKSRNESSDKERDTREEKASEENRQNNESSGSDGVTKSDSSDGNSDDDKDAAPKKKRRRRKRKRSDSSRESSGESGSNSSDSSSKSSENPRNGRNDGERKRDQKSDKDNREKKDSDGRKEKEKNHDKDDGGNKRAPKKIQPGQAVHFE